MSVLQINPSRFNKALLSALLIAVFLYLGKPLLIPIAIAAFLAMLLYPMVQKLQRHNIKEPIAALISILVLLTTLALTGTLVYYQVRNLTNDLPRLEEKVKEKTSDLQWMVYQTTEITETEQDEIIKEKKPDIAKAVFKSAKDFLISGFLILLYLFIVLTFTFLFIIYQQRIQVFFVRLQIFYNHRESQVMMTRITRIIHDYLKGTFTVISIMAIVYGLGLWLIGIEHAFLFALITALLRIVPYFGSYLGIAITVGFTVLTADSLLTPVLVLAFFILTQLLEANLLTPYITGSRVKLNPLATIIAILLGNLLWGVPGMILFVPIIASLKIIFDRIPRLQPYGYMLGKE